MHLSFHGAAGTVTGSRYLLEHGKRKILIDCGMFQGRKELRLRNWNQPSFAPGDVDMVLLTHAHLDHCGWLPRLAKLGFQGVVLATEPSAELARIVLADAAKIQEEDARYANKKGHTRHHPALPLFDSDDAEEVMKRFRAVSPTSWEDLGDGLRARWLDSGHLLGASSIEIEAQDNGTTRRLLFSGDIGRYDFPLHVDPSPRPESDLLVIESTYGGRQHKPMLEEMYDPVAEALGAGGVVMIPAFALGRSQLIALMLLRRMDSGALPKVPIHLDSPMAIRATQVYYEHLDKRWVDEDVACCEADFLDRVTMHSSAEESKKLNGIRGPRVIIAGSGMMTGGRILHHVRQQADKRENLILLVGYQADGTRGRRLLNREKFIRFHGKNVPIRCQVSVLNGLSGHADEGELLRWYQSNPRAPAATYVTHGEPKAADALADVLRKAGAPAVMVPTLGERVSI
ncbi:MAG: MBL fold hydrolase [Gemmatimonadota bacterium]|nr:MAG: MBL fold hydrolase [Gemmatimonadota bacterium]